jgi:alpha-D-xyloside xylohydrolase
MFGPAFLVCPVVTPMYYDNEAAIPEKKEKKRNVYLPEKTTWYDFYTGKAYKGGQVIKADAPIDQIPLFVRQGSIIPMGPVVQHTGELPGKEIEIIVYPGKDADFTLYEDEGDNYNYEQGAFTTIKLTWNDKKKVLTLGKRTGEFDAMEKIRSMRIVLHTPNEQKSSKSKVIRYSGEEVKCKF